ncbi:MAG: BamA/TamA family outer membrane protein [Acidobacteria bacterium]|nr:BamA/TamA family outer membrane protein [Acidobacteriota bacterium]
MARRVICICVSLLIAAVAAHAQDAPRVTGILLEQEGRPLDDPSVLSLIETRPGAPLSMREVRDTITHLASLNRFEDIQVLQDTAPDGVRLRYVLVPLHPVDRLAFRGSLGLSQDDLQETIVERFGIAPSGGRLAEVQEALRVLYRDRGYPAARITPSLEETHNPDRATMTFDIDAGSRSRIGRVEITAIGSSQTEARELGINVGDPYDDGAIVRELADYVADLRARGYYEAQAVHTVSFEPDGTAVIRLSIARGPLVSVVFAGDPLPSADREMLVPVRAEGSADEDLLEDGSAAIEAYLRARGYRDAVATFTRQESGETLTITFQVSRGPRFIVETVTIDGETQIPDEELAVLARIERGRPYVQTAVGLGAAAIRDAYRRRGFTRATVQPAVTERPPDARSESDRLVDVRFGVTEGPQTIVGGVTFEGNAGTTEASLRTALLTMPNRPYSEGDVASDRDRIDIGYRNRGFDSVVVNPQVTFQENGTRADVRFVIVEGPQVFVDHVIILGNQRTSTATITREVLLKPGGPLGYQARIETQQRLTGLGLFRRVTVEELRHGGEARRDVLIRVEEAPPTTIGYGGGVEGGTRLRPTGESGLAEERFEMAPRGFFEIGRRNLWGKNRAVNLFTRVSLRSRDITLSREGIRLERPAPGGGYGFNEYRVVGTFREPRVFDTSADGLVTGIIDQAIRSSFNFVRREARAELGYRVSQFYSLAGRYSYEQTRLFDERFTDEEKPLIDRLFPQVRLSKFSGSMIRDTRTDVIDPGGGTFVIVDSEVAIRAVGSEVGFTKTFLQGFTYYRVPVPRRVVLALGGRLGLAHGFRRSVPREGADGQPVRDESGAPIVDVVQDLPASERFFAGGDTTVRGFSLDRLGTAATISPTGFPTGGNGLIVLNAELRTAVVGNLGMVAFFDAGNVFPRIGDISVSDIRAAAGAGLRYQSPVGPIRIDLGFKLDRRELAPGRLERRSVLHISLGQAF